MQRDGELVEYLVKSKSGRFAKTLCYSLRPDKKSNCNVMVTGKAVNHGDGQGMQVPNTLRALQGTIKIY